MKKLMLLAAVAVFSLSNVNAQELRAGLTGGFPIGDAGDAYTFSFGLDVTYLFFEATEGFMIGASTGYNTTAGDSFSETYSAFGVSVTEKYDVPNFDYIPLAAAARYKLADAFVVGADLGFAISTGDADGGFYYRPMVGYNFTEKIQATASYRGISVENGTFSTINIGANYRIL